MKEVVTTGGALIAAAAVFAIASVRRGFIRGSLPVRIEDLFEAGPDALLVVDGHGKILAANRLVEALFGWPRVELIGQRVERLSPASLRKGYRSLRRNSREDTRRLGCSAGELSVLVVRRDGTSFPADVTLSPLANGVVIAAVRDATDRQAKVAEILFLNRIYSTLAETHQLVGRCASEGELFERVCQVAVRAGKFTLAWIGRPDASGALVPVASCGGGEFTEYLRGIAVHIDAARPEGRGPSGIAWREARAVFVQDFGRDERVAFWRRSDRPVPWGASAALPIRRAGSVHAVLSLYDTQAGAFSDKVVDLLHKMVMHIEYALDRLDLMAESRKREERIARLLNFDPLTALPNRRFMLEHLDYVVCWSGPGRGHGAVLLLGLDRFQTINDILGHQTGDRVLQEIARRLRAAVRGADLVGRVGGDEFLVVLENVGADLRTAADAARQAADRLLATVLQPYLIGEQVASCSASIGIAVWGAQGSAAGFQELLGHAEVAMRAAKNNGRNTSRLFTPGMQLAFEERSRLEARLRHEFSTDQLQLYFQKRVGRGGTTLGAEALLRWHDPQRGLISPTELVPVAEEIGLIYQIGRWALGRACRQLQEWSQSETARRLCLAVNVSPRQLADDAFVDEVIDILARTGADPHLLELEVTEGLPIQDIEEVIPKMHALRALGVRFAIDDFGVGYSSLSYLRQLPISILKIDRSFVAGLGHPEGERLVHTIVQMARSLDLTVIAEGVESRWQWDTLSRHGCDQYQGYLFGRPVPIEVFDGEFAAA